MGRIWIYQADRMLTGGEAELIKTKLDTFTGQWESYGKDLAAWATIRYGLFIIIGIDESIVAPSGCSIDQSVYLLKDLEQELGVGLFGRTQIAFRDVITQELHIANRDEFEHLIQEGVVHQNTIVFNNLISAAEDLEDKWEVPLKDSWHIKVFDNVPYSE